MRFPRPLRPGDTIGVTAPSSGITPSYRPRLDAGVRELESRGYRVVVGECLGAERFVSAPKEQRAAELTAMLADPEIRAVVPPWGGEMAIDLLDRIGWETLADAEPTWLVGFSDLTTLMVPVTLRLGWATLHGSNLMDTPYAPPAGLLHWTDVASATAPFTQTSPGRYRSRDSGWDDYEGQPAVSRMTLDRAGSWRLLAGDTADFSGRLIGGCIETIGPLAATPYGDVRSFGREHAVDGLVVYLEAAEDNAFTIARTLHALRYAGWFEHAAGVLIGRTNAPGADGFSQADAVADALGDLGIPVVLDVECGHVQPFLPLVNGALARVVVDGDRQEIIQTPA